MVIDNQGEITRCICGVDGGRVAPRGRVANDASPRGSPWACPDGGRVGPLWAPHGVPVRLRGTPQGAPQQKGPSARAYTRKIACQIRVYNARLHLAFRSGQVYFCAQKVRISIWFVQDYWWEQWTHRTMEHRGQNVPTRTQSKAAGSRWRWPWSSS